MSKLVLPLYLTSLSARVLQRNVLNVFNVTCEWVQIMQTTSAPISRNNARISLIIALVSLFTVSPNNGNGNEIKYLKFGLLSAY